MLNHKVKKGVLKIMVDFQVLEFVLHSVTVTKLGKECSNNTLEEK